MLDYTTARHCYELIQESSQAAYRRELFAKAAEYARLRTQWLLFSREQRLEMDRRRAQAHNAFIAACNSLAREMTGHDEDDSWRIDLGDDRKLIGDLACYIHCFLGIEAR